MKKLPTLVTYRSAIELRDNAIRYAYHKSMMVFGCFLVANGVVLGSNLLLTSSDTFSSYMLFAVAVPGLILAVWFHKLSERFVRYPRLSFDELDDMQARMGLSAEIFQQTHDAVIHGTAEDHVADQAAESK